MSVFTSLADLQTAVSLWCTDPATAYATYSDIASWDVSTVTSFDSLFSGCTAFNDNINAWNTSSVTSLRVLLRTDRTCCLDGALALRSVPVLAVPCAKMLRCV